MTECCNVELLRAQLQAALIEAERYDPIVAIHIDTALALITERYASADQSSDR